MKAYMTTIIGTNKFGGPFSKAWEIQQWLDEQGYEPEEWDLAEATREELNAYSHRRDPDELKQDLDAGEYDYPCGERVFEDDTIDSSAWTTESGYVEVSVTGICEKCGFRHEQSAVLNPEP